MYQPVQCTCKQVREDSATLTILECTMELAGVYECKAVSDLGQDKTRATLTVNSKLFDYTGFGGKPRKEGGKKLLITPPPFADTGEE